MSAVVQAPALLSVHLRCDPPVVARGSLVPVTITVANDGEEPVWVVGVVDGSEVGARYPKWTPIVEGPTPVAGPERPDFTSPLTAADFRCLLPRETFDPTVAADGAQFFPIATFDAVADAVGRYVIALEMDTMSPNDEAWMGTVPDYRPDAKADAARVRDLLAQVPRLRVRSNRLEIVVR